MKNRIEEKRRYIRIKKRLPLRLSVKEFDTIVYTTDISQRGALCELNCHIPLMSKLQIKLLLPDHKNHKNTADEIKCLGVVVRSHPVTQSSGTLYDTAIFFTKVSKGDERKIANYIKNNPGY